MKRREVLMAVAVGALAFAALADMEPKVDGTLRAKIAQKCPVTGEDVWHGHARVKFSFMGRGAWIVCPSVATAQGTPWTWTMQWADAFVERTGVPDLLKRGYHHVTIDLFDTHMNTNGLRIAAAFQDFLVKDLGFAPQANLIGMSWGGFFSIRYASTHPQNVRRIYLDAPLMNFDRFAHVANGVPPSWFGPTPAAGWTTSPEMPVNRAAPIAKAGIPILLAYGAKDATVPSPYNCELFIPRFKAAGGRIDVFRRENGDHHPHGFDKTDVIVRFFATERAVGTCIGGENGVRSPNGRNEIRLSAKPLAVEVLRDGASVAKVNVGLDAGLSVAFDAADLPEPARADVPSRKVASPVYKKSSVDVGRKGLLFDFGNGVKLEIAARDDGVAYRFVTAKPGEVTVRDEKVDLAIPDPDATCWSYRSFASGWEESACATMAAKDLVTDTNDNRQVYLPLSWRIGKACVAFTESDIYDYPILNFTRKPGECFKAALDRFPTKTIEVNWDVKNPGTKRLRKRPVTACADYLVKTEGVRMFPWRVFVLGDSPAEFPVADIVWALARETVAGDFAWVKPGKVAWDWWNAFDNLGEEKGCTTAGYKRFVDFAAANGVEYVIMDEGWSETLDIWHYSPRVDVDEVIRYANAKGVGIILWMAWAQIQGEEEKVAQHFAKIGAKGFKVDFMDRGDADVERFLWKFADACAKAKMLVDYHGAHRPAGMSRAYPNVLNYEGVRGLENMKWYGGGDEFMDNDLDCFFFRLAAGPMDYTPGAMDNYPMGSFAKDKKPAAYRDGLNPGSLGTRCRQMAMMVLYEAPLQMLSDSPTKYEKNVECFRFMSATPVVWADAKALPCDPSRCAAIARRARDGAWYAAAMANAKAQRYTLDTSFLGAGTWKAEIFRDAANANTVATAYAHETKRVKAGEKLDFALAPGGGFVVRFAK